MSNESEQAEQLARFLLNPERYGQPAPLKLYVETEIKAMAKKIAGEIVAAHEELPSVIRRQTEHVIREALREDSYLNRTVTDAVAKTITEIALQRREADE